ncbi:MAG: aminoacyl-tRNA hydrolase [Planctomycetota bacterium]|nr:MAG: aminoacyl-tRNA hydrolase [Planctomycetota bacterium]
MDGTCNCWAGVLCPGSVNASTPENAGSESLRSPPDGVRLGPRVVVPAGALRVSFVRSSGPGGQHVNKRATKCQLRIRLEEIPMSEAARGRLERLAASFLTEAGEILIQDDSTRSQARNRRACVDRLSELVTRALVPPKKRKPTKPSKGAVRRRLDEKKQQSEKKERRRRLDGQ